MTGLVRRLVDDARHGKWAADVIVGARKQAARATTSDARLIYVGMQHGVVDAADFLSPRMKRSRLFQPDPDVTPSSRDEVHRYLAGYLSGHLMTRLFHARVVAGQSVQGPDATHVGEICALYASELAAPKVQERLALGTDDALLAAHDAAMIKVVEKHTPVEEGMELAVLEWLAARSNTVLDDAQRAAALRLRGERPAKVGR